MNKAMKEKLDEIMDKEVVVENKRLSHDDIQAVEKKYNIELPSEYKEFITNSIEMYIKDGYGFPLTKTSNAATESGFETMDYLYVSSLQDNIKSFLENYREDMVPIGEACGDIICMGIKGDKYGKIYYLYHEDENEENIYLAAPNFQEFILSFQQIEEEDSIDLDKIKMELDEDLL